MGGLDRFGTGWFQADLRPTGCRWQQPVALRHVALGGGAAGGFRLGTGHRPGIALAEQRRRPVALRRTVPVLLGQ